MENEDDNLKALSTYIDGRMKRYSLLFSVNGGAFAIIKFSTTDSDIVSFAIGAIKLNYLAIGAILFTYLIFIDIWAWGSFMRDHFSLEDSAFTPRGQFILIGLSSLLVYIWLFVGFYPDPTIKPDSMMAILLLLGPPIAFGVSGAILTASLNKCPQDSANECTSD